MTEKQMFVLVLRLSGVWTMLQCVMAIPWGVSFLMKLAGLIPLESGSFQFPTDYMWTELLRVPTYFLFGFVLLTKAPLIASFLLWFSNVEEQPLRQSVDAVSLERIALQVLGFYALLQALPFVSGLIASMILKTSRNDDLPYNTSTACYAVAAFALIFGARRISRLLTPEDEHGPPEKRIDGEHPV